MSWFEFWSKRRPDDLSPAIQLAGLKDDTDKRAVAVRAALRGLYGMARIDDAPWSLSAEIGAALKLQVLRAVFVSWCEILYDGVRPGARSEAFGALAPLLATLDAALPDFYKRNIMSSDYAVSAWQAHVEAGRRAAALAEAIETLEWQKLAFDRNRSWSDSFDTLAHFGPDGRDNQAAWRAAQRAAIGADCAVLRERAMTPRELVLAPLWPDMRSGALATNLHPRQWKDLGPHAETWLRERKDGALVMGKDPQTMAIRMVGIANLPRGFWEDRHADDAQKAFDYALYGDLGNPHWGV